MIKVYPKVLLLFFLVTTPLVSAADSRFGVMTHFAQGWDPSWADLVAGTSLADVRDELYWNTVESTPGVYNFSSFDAYMLRLKQDQITPLIIMSFENSLYDGGNTPYSDHARAAYANYGAAILNHYGSQVKALEIWNEYNGGFCKGPATNDREGNYTQMIAAAYPKIKALRPDVTVLGGSTIGVPLPYWENLMKAGALQYMDALSIHPYRYSLPPEGIENDIFALQQLTAKYNGGQTKPIWVTEIGWQENENPAPGDLFIDQTTEAKYLVRAYALLLSANVQHVYWYLFRDYLDFTMGIYQADRTPKVAASAMSTMIGELSGFGFLAKETTPDGFYSLVFQNSLGQPVRVLWALAPTVATLHGATRIVDMTGNILPGGTLTISDAPLFVEGNVTGIPSRPNNADVPLANAQQDFSGTQGGGGWSYGNFVGASTFFIPMTQYSTTAWSGQWSGVYPYAEISPSDQHPSFNGAFGVSTVRRWTSNFAGKVHVTGLFQCGTQGDGVGVSILINGQPLLARILLGNGASIQTNFDLWGNVQVGSTIDFCVDPGSSNNVAYDATTLQARIAASNNLATPTAPPSPTVAPSPTLSPVPTASPVPTSSPSSVPTNTPTALPSASPTPPPSPNGNETIIADVLGDFSGTQGLRGWSYGSFPTAGNSSFEAATQFSSSAWLGKYAQLNLTSTTQHPAIGLNGLDQVAAVRRWTSSLTGTVHVVGQFSDTRSGDGAGVTVLLNGIPVVARVIIGVTGNSLTHPFDFTVPVSAGSTLDFAADPGPGRDVNSDDIKLSATISTASSSGSAPSTTPSPTLPPLTTPTPTAIPLPTPTPQPIPTPIVSPIPTPSPAGGASGTLLADSANDFAGAQGTRSWTYGDFANERSTLFETASTFSAGQWSSGYRQLALTATTQHPAIGANGLDQVSAVRRWTSTYSGTIRVTGQFLHSRAGDGVGVRILLNGQNVLTRTLIGVTGIAAQLNFDFPVVASTGDTLDFAVDPGPARDLNGDNPTVTVKITIN